MKEFFTNKSFYKLLINLFILHLLVSCGGGSSAPPSSNLMPLSLSISPDEITLASQASKQLSALVLLSDKSLAIVTDSASWQSDNNAVVEVNAAGLLTAKAEGKAIITASYQDIDSSVRVTVSAAALNSITIEPGDLALAAGTTSALTAYGHYADNRSEELSANINWSSATPSVASVNADGLLTAESTGSAVISAGFNGVTNEITVTVTAAVLTSISISTADNLTNNSFANGTEQTFIASGHFSNDTVQDISDQVDWTIDNAAIAVFDVALAGKLKALSVGSATISASLSAISAEKTITVSAAVLSSIEIITQKNSLPLGTSLLLEARAIFSDDTTRQITNEVNWLSSDQLIISVTASGAVLATGAGSAEVTAVYQGQSAEVSINVSAAVLTEIQLSPLSTQIPAGVIRLFKATGIYSDNTNQDITEQVNWSASNSHLTINNLPGSKGQAESISAGVVIISATKDSISANKIITVTDAIITTINVLPAIHVTQVGSVENYQAIAQYSDGSTRDISAEVEWSSSDNSVAYSANSSFEIHANPPGPVTISARHSGLAGFASLTVNSASLVSISIDQVDETLAKGTTLLYTATGHYSDASSRDISHEVSWSVDDASTVLINQNTKGVVELRALTEGVTTIRAVLNSVSDETSLTVSSAVLTSIVISADANTMLAGTSIMLTATGTFSDSSTQDVSSQATWKSSDILVAEISNSQQNKGELQAFNAGNVDISAQINSTLSNTYNVTVNFDPDAPQSISLVASPNVVLNNNTDSAIINATVKPALTTGVIADNTQVDFNITEGVNSYSVSVGTVNGVASYAYSTNYTGLVSISASLQSPAMSSSAAILAVTDFIDVIKKGAFVNPIYDGTTLYAGSVFGLLAFNVSNRDFSISQLEVRNGLSHLPDSPIDGAALSSGSGILNGGQLLWLVYALDEDVINNGISASLLLNDVSTASDFGYQVNFVSPN